jgi:hypothetical protein
MVDLMDSEDIMNDVVMQVCMYIRMYACTYLCMYVCTYVRMYGRMYVYAASLHIYNCSCVCVNAWFRTVYCRHDVDSEGV